MSISSPAGFTLSADAAAQPTARPGSSPDDTPALTRRLAAGEESAFREFHARYFDRLYHFLLVVARGNEQEAEEVLQETLVRVARYARVMETEETLWCWLKAVARSAARDAGRRQTRYARLLERFAWRWKIFGPGLTGAEETGLPGLLEDSLAQLEPDERQLVESKYVQGLSVRQLAERTGLSEKALESRLLRLRRRLREDLLRQLRNP